MAGSQASSGLGNLVKKREMALAEVRRRKMAEEFFPIRQQVLRRIFTDAAAQRGSRAGRARLDAHFAARNHRGMRREN